MKMRVQISINTKDIKKKLLLKSITCKMQGDKPNVKITAANIEFDSGSIKMQESMLYIYDNNCTTDPDVLQEDWKKNIDYVKEIILHDTQNDIDINVKDMDTDNVSSVEFGNTYLPDYMLREVQFISIPIKGENIRFTKSEYNELASIIRANDNRETAEYALENYECNESLKAILSNDSQFSDYFHEETTAYTGEKEQEVIDDYIYDTYGSLVKAEILSNKGTNDEIIQDLTLPENIINHLIEDLRELQNGAAVPEAPVLIDDDYDTIDFTYVDEINIVEK